MRKNEFLVPNKKACDECLCNNGLRNCRYPIQIVSIAPLNTLQMSYQKLLGSFHLKSEQHSLIWILLDCITLLASHWSMLIMWPQSKAVIGHIRVLLDCITGMKNLQENCCSHIHAKYLLKYSLKIFQTLISLGSYSSSIWTVATKRKFEGQFGGYCRGQQI